MNSTDRQVSSKQQPIDRFLPWLLSISATPSVAGAIVVRSGLKWLADAGIASEEVFRGNRLPVLPFPAERQERQASADE